MSRYQYDRQQHEEDADARLQEGIEELKQDRSVVIDAKMEAAEESFKILMMSNLQQFLDAEDPIGWLLVSEVDELIETFWPDLVLWEAAKRYSLTKEQKLELLRRFRSSISYSRWVEENGSVSSGLAGLERNWEAE